MPANTKKVTSIMEKDAAIFVIRVPFDKFTSNRFYKYEAA